MAQQKIFLAVCAVAGLVALVAAQNPMDCANKARASLEAYRSTVMQASSDLAQNLQSQGVSMADAQKLREQIDKMISDITSMFDVQNGVDPQKVGQGYFKILQSQVAIFRIFMNIDGATALTNEYFKFAGKMMDANTGIFLQIAKDCTSRY